MSLSDDLFAEEGDVCCAQSGVWNSSTYVMSDVKPGRALHNILRTVSGGLTVDLQSIIVA